MLKKNTGSTKVPDGRKYRLSIICIFVLLIGFGLTSLNPVFSSLYSELVTAILGILFIYSGGNIANKWTVGRNINGLSIASNQIDKGGVSTNGDVSNRNSSNRE